MTKSVLIDDSENANWLHDKKEPSKESLKDKLKKFDKDAKKGAKK